MIHTIYGGKAYMFFYILIFLFNKTYGNNYKYKLIIFNDMGGRLAVSVANPLGIFIKKSFYRDEI